MRLSIGIFTLFGLLALITLGVILWSIPGWFLAWFGVFLLVVSGLFIVGLLLLSGLLGKKKLKKKDLEIKLTEAQLLEAQNKAAITVIVAKQDEQVHIRDLDHQATWRRADTDIRVYANGHYTEPKLWERQSWEHRNQPKIIDGKSNPLLLSESTQVIDALQFALFAERAIVKGKSDAGKTTFLLALAARSKNVIVIDPHNSPDKWPGCAVIGGGENFPEISQRLKWLYDTMQQRYRDLHAGKVRERQFDPLTLITDEVLAIIDECPDSKDYFRKLVTRARKVNISVYLGSHSELVKPLGLEGAGDIRESYVFIRLYYSYISNKRSVTVDEGNGEIQAVFNDAGYSADGQPPQLPELVTATQESTNTDKVLDLFDHSGLTTPTAICMRIYGYKKTNLIAEIRQILVDHGRLGYSNQ